MSHNVTVSDIKINDITALQEAINELSKSGVKISLLRDAQYRGFSASQSGNYPFVIRLDDSPYDIALAKQPDGTYAPVFDPWAGHVQRQVGVSNIKDCELIKACDVRDPRVSIGRLMQTYGVVKAEREAALKGLATQRVQGDKGQVSLVVNYN